MIGFKLIGLHLEAPGLLGSQSHSTLFHSLLYSIKPCVNQLYSTRWNLKRQYRVTPEVHIVHWSWYWEGNRNTRLCVLGRDGTSLFVITLSRCWRNCSLVTHTVLSNTPHLSVYVMCNLQSPLYRYRYVHPTGFSIGSLSTATQNAISRKSRKNTLITYWYPDTTNVIWPFEFQ